MISITAIDHIGIRVRERDRAVAFYGELGFEFVSEGRFDQGQPVILRHPSGIVLNLLGPAVGPEGNVLMDEPPKRTGYTHVALRVESLSEAEAHMASLGVTITEHMAVGDLRMFFVRDPDGNVIEFNAHTA